MSLFASDDPRRRAAVEAEDLVRHRYGDRAITRARLVRSRLPAPFERDPMTPVDLRAHAREERSGVEADAPIEPGEEPDPIVDDDVLA
jgi:hypothetical protein